MQVKNTCGIIKHDLIHPNGMIAQMTQCPIQDIYKVNNSLLAMNEPVHLKQ